MAAVTTSLSRNATVNVSYGRGTGINETWPKIFIAS